MEQPPVHHRLDHLLLWTVLCCLVTVVRSDRVMWVDTKGEDNPRCIHNTPVGALMAQPPPNRSCRSLQYAMQNTLNSTSIRVLCGTHEYFRSPDEEFPTSTLKVGIVGECTTNQPTVQCMNGTKVLFNGIADVSIREMVFQGCNKQEDPHIPILYFSNSINVRMQHVTVHIMGSYGTGISLKHTAPRGKITLYNVSILHNGTHGIGLHCDILRNASSTADHLTLAMNHILVINTNTNTTYEPSMAFTGIIVTTRGTGHGSRISMHNITVFNSAPVTGFGVFIGLFHDIYVHMHLAGLKVFDGWDKHYQSRSRGEVLAECAKRQLAIRNSPEFVLANYSAVMVELWSSHSSINITDVQVTASYAPSGGAAVASFKGQSKHNTVHFENVSLAATGNIITSRQGLLLNFVANARENKVGAMNVTVINSGTKWGGGAHLVFDDQCMENSVQIYKSTFTDNFSSKYGGGVAAQFIGHAKNNAVSLLESRVENNTAGLGGGIMILLDDFSSGNNFTTHLAVIGSNKAYSGGGMYIKFHHSSERNIVILSESLISNNSLLPHVDIEKMGGGVSIEFATNKAPLKTNNKVSVLAVPFIQNNASDGVGGGLSVFYVPSPNTGDSGDKVYLECTAFWNNQAEYGQEFALQSTPQYRKALFSGITLNCTWVMPAHGKIFGPMYTMYMNWLHGKYSNNSTTLELSILVDRLSTEFEDLLLKTIPDKQQINSSVQVMMKTNMVLLISVQVRIFTKFICMCGAGLQGLLALDSEIALQPDSRSQISCCIASHGSGGGVALYGKSHIRLSVNSTMVLGNNFAFQRGGALYVDSTQNAASHFYCFLQYEQDQIRNDSYLLFINNSARLEGQSLYISHAQSCYSNNVMNQLFFAHAFCPLLHSSECIAQMVSYEITQNELRYRKCIANGSLPVCTEFEDISHPISQELLLHPNYVDGVPDNLSSVNVQFIPGIQKQLPYKHAYDKLGNVINTVFTVQIISQEGTAPVQLNPFSKYTADFTVILHGVPLQHGGFKHSFNTSTSNTSGAAPLLVLQSVDNEDLLLVVNIELQCCPPGYTFRYGSEDNGTCHCGMLTVMGIAKCNEIDPNDISAVLQRDHWAGYLPSNDQHSCDGQKLFSAPCPPEFCQTQQTALPNNNSRQLLEEIVCKGSNRKGLLCGDCLEGNGIAVNFNGIRPVCVRCQEGLSNVGLLVWILSEWVPMLILMFIVLLFNVDLVSGGFNSFLLFAQLLSFCGIRADAELGPVHFGFVKIYKFLYGVWNLEFLGVLLPPYCLIPQARLTLLQTLLLHYSIGLFPLTVAITLTVLERSAEKWICCHRVDQCLRRMRWWKAKYSDGMSYDRALPAFVILGFTRFLVSSAYILVNQTIRGEDGEEIMVVWWQGSVPYGSIQHIAYLIPAIVILLLFVLLPSVLLLTLPLVPQLFGRLIIAVPALRKLQRMQTFCSNVYTDRWVYHFVNVFQGCYKDRFRSFSSLYLFHRIIQLFTAIIIPRAEDALHVQLILTMALLLLIVICQPYNSSHQNTMDAAILGNLALILILSRQIADVNTLIRAKLFYATVQMILIYLPLLYPGILFGRKVYLKFVQLKFCKKRVQCEEDEPQPLLVDPAEGLGSFAQITELRAGVPTSSDEETESVTQSEEL